MKELLRSDLINYKLIFFDFDGVIKDSNRIKTQAFQELFKEFGNKISSKVVNHHIQNMGISRYDKITYYYKEFLNIYGEFPEIIERNLPKNARWIRDVTISNSTWGNRLMPVQKWYQNIYPVGAGIGPGMSLGIGASLATEEKVKSIAMCGDGGFMLNISELWTAVEINSNIIFMVMNDKGYGVIKHIQDSLYGGRKNFADLQVPNFKELADTVKMKYLIVKSSSEFENILKKAFNLPGPVLLEIDINSIGELPRYFIPPPFTEK